MATKISVRMTIAGLCLYAPDDRNAGEPVVHVVLPVTGPGHGGHGHGGGGHPKHTPALLVDPVYLKNNPKPGKDKLESYSLDGRYLDLSTLSSDLTLPKLPEEIVDIEEIQNNAGLRLPTSVVDHRPADKVAAALRLRGGEFFPGPSRYLDIKARRKRWVTGLLDWRLNTEVSGTTLSLDLRNATSGVIEQSLTLTPFDDTIWLALVHLQPSDVPKFRSEMLYPERTGDDHFRAYYTLFDGHGPAPAESKERSAAATAADGPMPDPYVICTSPRAKLA